MQRIEKTHEAQWDSFAGKAMAVILEKECGENSLGLSNDEIADAAYEIAFAMMKERTRWSRSEMTLRHRMHREREEGSQ